MLLNSSILPSPIRWAQRGSMTALSEVMMNARILVILTPEVKRPTVRSSVINPSMMVFSCK